MINPGLCFFFMKHKNRVVTAVTVVAVVVVLIASYVMQSNDDQYPKASAFPDPIQEGDLDYPPAAGAEERYGEVMSSLEASLSDASLDVDAMARAISVAMQEYKLSCDKYELVIMDYYASPDLMSSEYQAWSNMITVMSDRLSVALKDGLAGPCADTVEAALISIGEDPDTYRGYGAMSEKVKALQEREVDLIGEYDAIMAAEYTVADSEGRVWTLEDIEESEVLTEDQKISLKVRIYEEQCADAAEVYVELVGVRNDYAAEMGYGNYAEYAYKELYGMDLTSSEAEKFFALAKKSEDMRRGLLGMMGYDWGKLNVEMSWFSDLDSEGLIKAVEPFIDSVDPDFARLLDYMTEYGLINNCSEPGCITTAYTAPIHMRKSAVIYNGYLGIGEFAPLSLVGGFGYAANYCLVAGSPSYFDVWTANNTGLEALYCASGLVGNGSERAATCIFSNTLLLSVVIGGFLTEFETWAYVTEAETGTLTADQALDRFGEIVDSVGYFEGSHLDTGYYLSTFDHIFSSPLCYTGYGASAINAMELYLEAIEDYDGAKQDYLAMLYQNENDGYLSVVERAGLTNAFDIEESEKILDGYWEALRALGA